MPLYDIGNQDDRAKSEELQEGIPTSPEGALIAMQNPEGSNFGSQAAESPARKKSSREQQTLAAVVHRCMSCEN